MTKIYFLTLLLCSFSVLPAIAQFTGCPDGTENPSVIDAQKEIDLMNAVNAARASQGKAALIRNSDLDRVARYQAEDQALEGYFDHKTYDGSSATDCMSSIGPGTTLQCGRDERIKKFYIGTNVTNEETLAIGFGTGHDNADSVVNGEAATALGWMNSSNHRPIMLNGTFLEAGFAYYTGGAAFCTNYWVMVVGYRDEAVGLQEKNKRGFYVTEAYPNPYHSNSKFKVSLAKTQEVDIRVSNMLGETVQKLHHGTLAAGRDHEFVVESADLPKGIYFYQVKGEDFSQIRKLILQR